MTSSDGSPTFDVEAYLARDLDSLIAQGLVCLVNPQNADALVGTGFFITPRFILTCQHVGVDLETLELRASDGKTLPVDDIELGSSLRIANSEFDLALIDIAREGLRHTWLPLPVAPESMSTQRLIGRAASDPAVGYEGSAPFQLRVVGRARVQHRRQQGGQPIDALDLEGSRIRPGASGAPLLDAACRAVVGVVIGGNPDPDVQRTWGVPISAAAGWQALADAVAWNNRAVPRFGMALNDLGARALFDIQRDALRAVLAREERFNEIHDVPRALAKVCGAEFLDSRQHVLAIVGPSNVGKSWMLAAFALSPAEDPAPGAIRVLLQARSIVRGAPPLSQLLQDLLKDFAGRKYPELRDSEAVPDSSVVLQALRNADKQLVVVLDGLNEAPDIHWFASTWLREAVGWAGEEQVRLVLSCRTESWPIIAEAAELNAAHFYLPTPAQAQKLPPRNPAEWCYTLSDFSATESALAAARYELDPRAPIGPHPLMYRLARLLEEQDTGTLGRYRVLERYVQRQLSLVRSKLGRGAAFQQQLRASLVRLADALSAGGEGSIPAAEANAIVGDSAWLDALVDEGLLSLTAEHVRFRHDQLADVLRTVREDALEGFARARAPSLDDQEREQLLASASIALLRFEADGDEGRYGRGLLLLLAAFESEDPAQERFDFDWELFEHAERIARSLPTARAPDFEHIYGAIAETATSWTGKARSLAAAPLSPATRARLLLRATCVAGAYSDRSGYPLRWKDWAEPSRRGSFAAELKRGEDWHRPFPSYIAALLEEFRDEVRPALMEALNDDTAIGSEASASSVSAGLLFMDASADFAGLFGELLQRSAGSDASRNLLTELVEGYTGLASPEILTPLQHGDRSRLRIELLCRLQRIAKTTETTELIRTLFRESLEPESGLSGLTSELAALVRQEDSHDLEAWDAVIRGWHRYGSAGGSVPTERVEQTLDQIRAQGPRFAQFAIGTDQSAPEVQARFVAALRDWRRSHSDEDSAMGMLIESKLDQLERDGPGGAKRAPWLDLAHEVALGPDGPARDTLIFCALHETFRRPWTLLLKEVFLRNPKSDDEFDDFVSKVVASNEDIPAWTRWVCLAREREPAAADARLWHELLARAQHYTDTREKAEALVGLWRADSSGTPTAASVLERLDAGETIDAVLKS